MDLKIVATLAGSHTSQFEDCDFSLIAGDASLILRFSEYPPIRIDYRRARWHQFTALYNCDRETISACYFKLIEMIDSPALQNYVATDRAVLKAYRELHHYKIFLDHVGCHELFAESFSIENEIAALSLDDTARWATLQHAYGPASDIPDLLRRLDALPASDGDSGPGSHCGVRWRIKATFILRPSPRFPMSFARSPPRRRRSIRSIFISRPGWRSAVRRPSLKFRRICGCRTARRWLACPLWSLPHRTGIGIVPSSRPHFRQLPRQRATIESRRRCWNYRRWSRSNSWIGSSVSNITARHSKAERHPKSKETIMGGFALWIPEHILEQAKEAAAEEQVSTNQFLVALISEGLGRRCWRRNLLRRAARTEVANALRILDGAPDVPPDEGDALPV